MTKRGGTWQKRKGSRWTRPDAERAGRGLRAGLALGRAMEADVVTDPAVSKRLFEVAATEDKTLKLIPGAKHADCFWREESYEKVRQWLATRTQRA